MVTDTFTVCSFTTVLSK